MRIFTTCILIMFILTNICCAQRNEPKKPRVMPATNPEETLRDVVPNELSVYQQAIAETSDLAAADAAISLVNATSRKWAEKRNDKQATRDMLLPLECANYYSWIKAIQTWEMVNDSKARNKILDFWNASLVNTPEVEKQIAALDSVWEPIFVTDVFKKLFSETKYPMVLHKFCIIFGDYGEDEAEALLKEKLTSMIKDKDTMDVIAYNVIVNNINSALRKIKYWRNGDPDRTGPPSKDVQILEGIADKYKKPDKPKQ